MEGHSFLPPSYINSSAYDCLTAIITASFCKIRAPDVFAYGKFMCMPAISLIAHSCKRTLLMISPMHARSQARTPIRTHVHTHTRTYIYIHTYTHSLINISIYNLNHGVLYISRKPCLICLNIIIWNLFYRKQNWPHKHRVL